MGLEKILLKENQVLVSQLPDANIFVSNSACLTGNVEAVNNLCDNYSVDQLVIFNPSSALKFVYESAFYYLLNEKDILITEL